MKEVQFRDLIIGENYFIKKVGSRGEDWGRAKGINYLGYEIFDHNQHSIWNNVELGLNTLKTAPHRVSKGDPLVKFQEIVPLNERHSRRNNCNLCRMTHLKPFNEGQTPGIGYKFYEITQDKLDKRTLALGLKKSLPPNLELNLKEIISEDLTGAEKGSLKNMRNKTGGDKKSRKAGCSSCGCSEKRRKGAKSKKQRKMKKRKNKTRKQN